MSALAEAKTPIPTSKSLPQAEADLRKEAVAIEKLRKQIHEAGSEASKEMMADFAKRQKAYLDGKIVLEKQKRGEAPEAKSVEKEVANPAEAPKPTKPSETPAAQEPAKPVEKKSSEKKDEPAPKGIADASKATKEPASSTSPAQKSGGISPIVWLLLIAAVAAVVWHFLGD